MSNIPTLPPGYTAHTSTPQSFDGVGWRDHSALVQRISVLETKIGTLEQEKSGTSAFRTGLWVAVLSALIAYALPYITSGITKLMGSEQSDQVAKPKSKPR